MCLYKFTYILLLKYNVLLKQKVTKKEEAITQIYYKKKKKSRVEKKSWLKKKLEWDNEQKKHLQLFYLAYFTFKQTHPKRKWD